MKRYIGSLILMVVFIVAPFTAGCSEKQKTAVPVAKSAQQIPNMEEGQWEITTTFEMPGMPAGMTKPQTSSTCLTHKDYVPKSTEQKDCTLQDTKIEGSTVTWTIVCKDSSAKGKVTYAGSTFDGVMETTMKQDDKDVTAKMIMKGKRIGPCNKVD
jgi:hypothetical protein